MSTCEQHKRDVAGISDMKQLAGMIGDLHYESLQELFYELKLKFHNDAVKDREAGRHNLEKWLFSLSESCKNAWLDMKKIWKICKPFMKEYKQQ